MINRNSGYPKKTTLVRRIIDQGVQNAQQQQKEKKNQQQNGVQKPIEKK